MCIRDRNKDVTEEQKRDLVIALITLKYTQSNSVCYTAGGQTIDVYKRQGEKSVVMIHVADINKVTGYVRGGCSLSLIHI